MEAERELVMEAVHQDTTYLSKYRTMPHCARTSMKVCHPGRNGDACQGEQGLSAACQGDGEDVCYPEHDFDFPTKMSMLCVV